MTNVPMTGLDRLLPNVAPAGRQAKASPSPRSAHEPDRAHRAAETHEPPSRPARKKDEPSAHEAAAAERPDAPDAARPRNEPAEAPSRDARPGGVDSGKSNESTPAGGTETAAREASGATRSPFAALMERLAAAESAAGTDTEASAAAQTGGKTATPVARAVGAGAGQEAHPAAPGPHGPIASPVAAKAAPAEAADAAVAKPAGTQSPAAAAPGHAGRAEQAQPTQTTPPQPDADVRPHAPDVDPAAHAQRSRGPVIDVAAAAQKDATDGRGTNPARGAEPDAAEAVRTPDGVRATTVTTAASAAGETAGAASPGRMRDAGALADRAGEAQIDVTAGAPGPSADGSAAPQPGAGTAPSAVESASAADAAATAPARAAEGAPPPAPSRPSAPADQVADAVRVAAPRVGEQVTVRLDPPELGHVRMTLRADGQAVRGVVEVENARALEDLQREAATLIGRLADGGVDVRRLDFQLSDPGGQNLNNNTGGQGAADGQGTASRDLSDNGGNDEGGSAEGRYAPTEGEESAAPAERVADESINVWM